MKQSDELIVKLQKQKYEDVDLYELLKKELWSAIEFLLLELDQRFGFVSNDMLPYIMDKIVSLFDEAMGKVHNLLD